jgi:hypothetical protein
VTLTMCAALAGLSVMTTMMTNPGEVPDFLGLDNPGIVIRAPHHLSPARAIPLKVAVEADMRTDEALRGFLIPAVRLVLVRQDRPGIFFDGAYDPHLSGYPEDLGLGDDSSSPGPPEPRDSRDTTGDMVEHELGHGVVDRGSGRYFLLGKFAKWWAPPQTIHISDPRGPAPADRRPVPVAATSVTPPFVAPSRPTLEISELGGRHFLRVTLPPPAPALHASSPEKGAKPFFTIVGFHLQTHGGAVGRVFTPQVPASTTSAIESTVSFASFDRDHMNRREISGPWVFLLFSGDQVSEPLTVTLTKSDY